MRHLLVVALLLCTASVALAQSPSTPAAVSDDVAAAVPSPGGWCEGKSDERGTNFGRCFGSTAKTLSAAMPESGGGSGTGASSD